MDQLTRRSLLFDFYGPLLTPKQQEIYDLYYQQDLSLGEIAQLQEVSRQAVFDLLRRTEEALNAYEEKLGLLQRHHHSGAVLKQLEEGIVRIKDKIDAAEFDSLRESLETLKKNW